MEYEKPKYTIYVDCRNCGFHALVDIDMGQTVQKTCCPQCGCKTLWRVAYE